VSTKEVDRQLYLLRALAGQKRGRTVEDLTQELEDMGIAVSKRTVYRDIDVLSRHFPITETERDNLSYYGMMEHFKLEDIQCSFDELMALVFINRMLEAFGKDPIVKAGRDLTSRLVSSLPQLQQNYLQGIYQNFRVELPGSQAQGGQIQTFIEAVRQRKEVDIRYHAFNSDEVSRRVIHPYTIYFRQQYYIVAYCTTREAIREFRLDRILDAQMLESIFQPREFRYEDYCQHSWEALKGDKDYQVVLHFAPESSRFIREYHGDKADSLRDLPDGSLEFCKTVSLLDEIFPWVLSQGADVKVVAPEELQVLVQDTIRRQAEQNGLI